MAWFGAEWRPTVHRSSAPLAGAGSGSWWLDRTPRLLSALCAHRSSVGVPAARGRVSFSPESQVKVRFADAVGDSPLSKRKL